jgi:hypothetical protein
LVTNCDRPYEYERDEQETGEYQKRADGGVEQGPERLVGNE